MSSSRSGDGEAWLREVGLRHVEADALTISRRRQGRGFAYFCEDGSRITDKAVLARIRSLAIPPNYREVRIAANPRAHLQATGRDVAGRLQYRYHPDWEEVRERGKVDRLGAIAGSIAAIRRRVARDLGERGLPRETVLAAVVDLIDRTHIRVGCSDYVHSGRSRGAATLLKRNVGLSGERVVLTFRGKGGREITCGVAAPALVKVIRKLRKLPGARLFQYRGEDGRRHAVTAAQVNAYLGEVTGASITAKDFRTLAATADAALRLARIVPEEKPRARQRQVNSVVKEIADGLGNTPAVARKSYVHRRVVEAFESGELAKLSSRIKTRRSQSKGEAIVAALVAPPRQHGRRENPKEKIGG